MALASGYWGGEDGGGRSIPLRVSACSTYCVRVGELSSETRQELWREGARWYRPAMLNGELDCEHLRPVQEHLATAVALIAALPEFVDVSTWTPALSDAWERSEQWLRMASGLAFVDVELSSFDRPYMCSNAMDYDEAADRSASLVMTEYTRLLYTWNATEVFVRAMGLPEVAGGNSPVNRASKRISDECSAGVPGHYEYLLKHLASHVKADPSLNADKRLLRSFEVRRWRTEAAILFAVSAQLRHVLAHGALRVPEPDRWGSDWSAEDEPIALGQIHAPRIGTRGLMLGLQTLVASVVPADQRIPGEELPSLVSDAIEASDPLLRDLLWNLHIAAH